MAKLNWTLQAKEDLDSIARYIGKDSVKYAKLQIKRIRNKASQLIKFPELGRPLPELGTFELRELIEGNYRIIYRVKSDERVDIITVHHSSKNLDIKKLN